MGAADSVGEDFVVLEGDAETCAAGIEFVRDETLGFVDAHRAFPTLRQSQFAVVQAVVLHGAPEDTAVEDFVVRDERGVLKPRPDLGVEILEGGCGDGVFGMNAVDGDVHAEVVVAWWSDQ